MEYQNNKEDKLYLATGVKPPERVVHGLPEDIEELKRGAQHVCKWVQRGNDIACDEAANFTHGYRISVDKRLVGTGAGGEPLLQDITISA